MSQTRASCAAGLVCLCLMVHSLYAQPPAFRSNVDLVRVNALITERGRPIAGLTAEDFEVLDNGVPQRVQVDALQDVPIDVVLVVDASGSIGGDAARLERAAQSVIADLRAQDHVAAVRFTHRVEVLARLTRDHALVRSGLKMVPAPGAYTSAIDALFTGLTIADPLGQPTLLLVVTDGLDTASWLDADTLLSVVARSSATISIVRPARGVNFPVRSVFRRACESTAGELFDAGGTDALERALKRVLARFRTRYELYYTPTATDAGWHRVEIKIRRRPGAAVHARPGYYRSTR
jgi:Ca-activated chloride channel homolog